MPCIDYPETVSNQCNNCRLYGRTAHCWIDYYTEELDRCIERGTVQRLLHCLIEVPGQGDYLNYLYLAVKYNRPELMLDIQKLRILR
jgi:hypothetical protein